MRRKFNRGTDLVELCLIRGGGVVGEQRTEEVGATGSSLESHPTTVRLDYYISQAFFLDLDLWLSRDYPLIREYATPITPPSQSICIKLRKVYCILARICFCFFL